MIKVVSFFFNKDEDGKRYDAGQVISHFTKKEEDARIKKGHAIRVKKPKKKKNASNN